MPHRAWVVPVQCCGQLSASLSPADQTLKYGSWTTSGTAGGRHADPSSAATAVTANAHRRALATDANTIAKDPKSFPPDSKAARSAASADLSISDTTAPAFPILHKGGRPCRRTTGRRRPGTLRARAATCPWPPFSAALRSWSSTPRPIERGPPRTHCPDRHRPAVCGTRAPRPHALPMPQPAPTAATWASPQAKEREPVPADRVLGHERLRLRAAQKNLNDRLVWCLIVRQRDGPRVKRLPRLAIDRDAGDRSLPGRCQV